MDPVVFQFLLLMALLLVARCAMVDTAPPFGAYGKQQTLLEGALIAAASDGAAVDCRGRAIAGFQLSVTGGAAPSYALKIQHCLENPNLSGAVWRDLPGCAFTAIAGNVEEWKEPTQAVGPWIRYVLAKTSGTVTLSLKCVFDQVGPRMRSTQGDILT